ncbi:MAG: glycosyltransferase [Anaerolineales bacterium]|nr:glycosyltransferase [Anaerolineales bacterium]
MRILIISYYFPPFNTIGAVRVGKSAKYLQQFGHEIQVITARDQAIYKQLLPPSLTLELPAGQVHYCGPGKTAQESTASPQPRWSTRLHAIRRSQLLWAFPAATCSNALLRQWQPDLIFASALPTAALLAAQRVSRKWQIPWVAELRDLWSDNRYIDYPNWRRHFEALLERKTLSSASGFVTVSEPLAEILRQKYHKPTQVIFNGFDPDDLPDAPRLPATDDKVQIVYTGSLYPGKRDPVQLFAALRALGPVADHFRVTFYTPDREYLQTLIDRMGVAAWVEGHAPIAYREALQQQRAADVLLLLIWDQAHAAGTLTGKIYEYIGARRPILMIGNRTSAAAALVRERSVGAVCTTASEISSQLQHWWQQKNRGGIPDLPEATRIGLSRLEQTRVLAEFLAQIRAGRNMI